MGLLTGCRVDVTTSITVDDDGSGTITVVAVADQELVEAAPGLADELRTDDLVEAGWTVDGPSPTSDGGLRVVVSHDFDGPDEATALLRQISTNAGPYRDLTVSRTITDDALTVTVDGTLGLRGGLRAFADDDLAALVGDVPWKEQLAAHGGSIGDALHAELLVSLPDGDTSSTSGTAVTEDGTDAVRYTMADDGSALDVHEEAVTDLMPDARAPVVASIAWIVLVVWLVVSIGFAAYVLISRRRRRLARLRTLGR